MRTNVDQESSIASSHFTPEQNYAALGRLQENGPRPSCLARPVPGARLGCFPVVVVAAVSAWHEDRMNKARRQIAAGEGRISGQRTHV